MSVVVDDDGDAPAPSPLKFRIIATDGRARATSLTLPHHECFTPMFMPVGTQGSVKGLTSAQLEAIECQVILGNTYHLGNRPGADVLAKAGATSITIERDVFDIDLADF